VWPKASTSREANREVPERWQPVINTSD
jgi:hypothetical protein